MTVVCATCKDSFEARHPKARYCSDRCRKNKGKAEVVELPAATADEPGPKRGPVETATVAELTEAGRLESALGQTCIVLARRLDNSIMDTGSAVSSMAARLEAMLATATKGAGKKTAPNALRDELAERRAAHGA